MSIKLLRQVAAVPSVLILFLSIHTAAQQGVFVTDRTAFESATRDTNTVNFESIAPQKGFGRYKDDNPLNIRGIAFKTAGGARFGAGTIYVPSAHYIALNPGYKMIDGAHLAWGAPNQPGNAHMEMSFPNRISAVGADLWTMQPIVSPVEVVATTRDGKSYSAIVTTKKRPAGAFIGFVTDSEIVSLKFTIAKGQSTMLLDNLTAGRKGDGADLALLGRASAEAQMAEEQTAEIQPTRPRARAAFGAPTPTPDPLTQDLQPASDLPPVIASDNPSRPAKNPTSAMPSSAPLPSAGHIYYVRGGKEIRMITPDGKSDRQFWTHADAHPAIGINELAWKPDGSELVVSSGHESVASFYHADLFTLRPDGTGAKKMTNGPDRSDFKKYPKGTVTVTVRNEQPIYRRQKASEGIFIVYVTGAEMPQPITLPPGSSRTLTFQNVADFGDHAQGIVAINAQYRWAIPGTDVKAGRTVKAPDFGISGDGFELYGAFRPVWKADGSRVSYRSGLCIVSSISAMPQIGHKFDPLFKGESAPAACAWDWGKTPATTNQLIYGGPDGEDTAIFRMNEGGTNPGERLVKFPKDEHFFLRDVRWLHDGSGFLYSVAELMQGAGNIYRYDLATRRSTRITALDDTFAGALAISPDGKWIVFERTTSFAAPDKTDLWMIGVDGKGMRLLVGDGQHAAWGR